VEKITDAVSNPLIFFCFLDQHSFIFSTLTSSCSSRLISVGYSLPGSNLL
jgi:hypothetical protein